MKKVTIIVGSESDRHIADKAVEVLTKFSVPYDLEIASAHRAPGRVREIVQTSGADVFICIAGLSAALPGFVASITPKPVIGVPVNVKLGGLDSLLSISQMPSGIPVATVGIDNGKNAAYLAIRILGLSHPETLTGETTYTETTIPGVSESSESSSYSSPDYGTESAVMPDFMQSTTPSEPVDLGIEKKEKKPRGDWL